MKLAKTQQLEKKKKKKFQAKMFNYIDVLYKYNIGINIRTTNEWDYDSKYVSIIKRSFFIQKEYGYIPKKQGFIQ